MRKAYDRNRRPVAYPRGNGRWQSERDVGRLGSWIPRSPSPSRAPRPRLRPRARGSAPGSSWPARSSARSAPIRPTPPHPTGPSGTRSVWQVRKRLTRGPIRRRAYGLDLEFPAASGSLSNLVYFGECFEWENINFLRRYLRPGDSVVDAGANVGMFTYAAAEAVAPDGRVEVFEPLAWAADAITANVERNRLGARVAVHRIAVADPRGPCSSHRIST